MPLIIGFCGHSGVGKDTSFQVLRNILADELTVEKVAFADGVKAMSYSLYSHVGHREPSYYDEHREARYIKLEGIEKTPVEIWCDLGDGMRNCVWRDTWSSRAIYRACNSASDIVCITDVRYPSEIDAIRDADGIVVKIKNDRTKPLDSNADHALDHWSGGYDRIIENNGDVSCLEAEIRLKIVPLIRVAKGRPLLGELLAAAYARS